MTNKQYAVCVAESANYDDLDAYVSDMISSSIWGDAPGEPIPPERLDQLRSIYAAASRPGREIVSAAGMTQAAFAEAFCIPLRTVENWCTGCRECPLYTRLMMQKCLGLLRT